MSVPADVLLEQRVAELVGQRRPMLEQLVRDALERELLAVLVEVDGTLGRLASSDGTPTLIEAAEEYSSSPALEAGEGVLEIPAAVEAEAPVALCARCGVEPRLPRGSYCRSCKRAADRASKRRRNRRMASPDAQDGPSDDGDSRPAREVVLPAVVQQSAVQRLEARTVARVGPFGPTLTDGHGITAAALLEFGGNRSRLGAHDLERWLLESGFASNGDGRLRPTQLGLEVGEALGSL